MFYKWRYNHDVIFSCTNYALKESKELLAKPLSKIVARETYMLFKATADIWYLKRK